MNVTNLMRTVSTIRFSDGAYVQCLGWVFANQEKKKERRTSLKNRMYTIRVV